MTTRQPILREDLGILAAESRERLGEPPTAEQLIALREGQLPKEEAERLRDLLAVAPEWASIYLELKHSAANQGTAEIGDADVDAAWEQVSRRLEVPSVAEHRKVAVPVEVIPARKVVRRFLPLAAGLFLGLGLMWVNSNRMSPPPTIEDKIHEIRVSAEPMRSHSMSIPEDTTQVAFIIELDGLELPPRFSATLFDSGGHSVRKKEFERQEANGTVRFEIPIKGFKNREAFRLILYSAEAPADPLFEKPLLLELSEDNEPYPW